MKFVLWNTRCSKACSIEDGRLSSRVAKGSLPAALQGLGAAWGKQTWSGSWLPALAEARPRLGKLAEQRVREQWPSCHAAFWSVFSVHLCESRRLTARRHVDCSMIWAFAAEAKSIGFFCRYFEVSGTNLAWSHLSLAEQTLRLTLQAIAEE